MINLIRQYQFKPDTTEFLFEVDDEFIEYYKEMTGEDEMTDEGFDRFMNEQIRESIDDAWLPPESF